MGGTARSVKVTRNVEAVRSTVSKNVKVVRSTAVRNVAARQVESTRGATAVRMLLRGASRS